jgi:pimeloyl-ACP methyl ester carboxylesterase
VAEEVCTVGDVELCFERFGDPSDPAVLLVMGLGTQMIAWHEDFCGELADRGFQVLRFDNRDNGRSTKLSHVAPPTLRQLALRDRRAAGYSLSEMADVAAGLLGQTVAIRHPHRVLSLVSIMSNTGARLTGQPALRVLPMFLRRTPRDREAYIEHTVGLYGVIGSPAFERDEAELRELAARAFERGIDPAGTGRQLAAIQAERDRTPQLRRVTAPTLVIHGTHDRLVSPSGGRATAKAVPGARLLTIKGMGHDMPRAVWPQIIDGIVENAARTEAPAEVG